MLRLLRVASRPVGLNRAMPHQDRASGDPRYAVIPWRGGDVWWGLALLRGRSVTATPRGPVRPRGGPGPGSADQDGTLRLVEASGPTAKAAEQALKVKLAHRTRTAGVGRVLAFSPRESAHHPPR